MAQDFFSSAMSQVAGAFNSGFNAIRDQQNFQNWLTQGLGSISTEATRQFDLNYELQKKQIDNQYQIAIRNAKTAEEAQRIQKWYQEQQVRLAESRLGLDYLTTAAQMRGPGDWAQFSDFLRGASQRQDVPVFVQALQNNTRMPAFQAAGGQPTPASADALLAQMTGQGGGGAAAGGANNRSQDEMAFSAIADIGARGANQLGGGALEQLLPEELQMLASGLERAGYSMPAFLTQYARSRVNNRVQDAARA